MIKKLPPREDLAGYYRRTFEALRKRYSFFDPVSTELFLNLLRTSDQFKGLLESRCRRKGLSGPAFGILNLLDTQPGGWLSMRQLSERILVSQANMTGLVDTLERQGHVRRVRHSKDRRILKIEITAAGRRKLESFRPEHLRFVREFLSEFAPSEKKRLIGYLERLRYSIQAWKGRALHLLLVFSALAFSVSFSAAQPAGEAAPPLEGLSLSSAVWEAVAKSPEVQKAAEEVGIASLEEPGLLALTDPVIGASASVLDDRAPRAVPAIQGPFTKSQEWELSLKRNSLIGTETQFFFKTQKVDTPAVFRPLNPTVDSRLGVELKQPLLRNLWGRPDVAKRGQARAGVRAALHRLERIREDAAARAALAFLEAFVARENIRIKEAAVEDVRRLRDKYLEKRRYGLVEASDLLQAEASLKVQETELRLARSESVRAENALKSALYRGGEENPPPALLLPEPPPGPVPSLPEAVAAAFSERGDYRAAVEEAERAKWFLRVEKLTTLPDLSIFGSYTSAGLNGGAGGAWEDTASFGNPVLSGGLRLEIPLGGKREKIRREDAERRLRAAKAEVTRLEERLRHEAADALERLSLSRDRVVSYRDLMSVEKRKLAAAENDFQRGRATTDLLIRFQGDIHRTEFFLLRAQADELASWADLGYASGSLVRSLAEWGGGAP